MSPTPHRLLPLLPALALTACVTINIYFPAAAAEKAADKIIDDIWQTAPGADINVKPTPETSSTPPSAAPAK